MKEERTGDCLIRTDWKRFRSITEADIHEGIEADPDVHPTNEEFWKDAKVVRPKE